MKVDIEDVRRLNAKAGEIVVVTMPENAVVDADTVAGLERSLPHGVKVLVVPHGTLLDVVAADAD